MSFKKGDRVSVPFGTEDRLIGKVKQGPYPAPADFREHQKRDFGISVSTVYDVKVPGLPVLRIAASYVRSAK